MNDEEKNETPPRPTGAVLRTAGAFILIIGIFFLVEILPLWLRGTAGDLLVEEIERRLPRILLVGGAVALYIGSGMARRKK